MRLATIIICAVFVSACGSSPVGPTNGGHGAESTGGATLPGGAGTVPAVIAVYTATFTASATCAFVLEPEARERTHTETLRSDGTIEWSGPTLNPPSGHATISSGVLSDNALSFSIDVERDPQSDDFHGLWEDFGSGKVLNISGKGSGVVRGAEVTGTFDGVFAVYDPLDPPQPGTLFTAHYCKARDHQFRFVKQ
jgi:hypothetical protein